MPVGNQASSGMIDNSFTNLSVQLRNIMTSIGQLNTFISNGAAGTPVEVLASLGYDNTNTDASGGQSDASYANYILTQLHTLAQVYFGQGTQEQAYDFNGALAPMWGGE